MDYQKRIKADYAAFQASFMEVLDTLQEAGIDIKGGEGPAALNLSSRVFNHCARGAAAGIWERLQSMTLAPVAGILDDNKRLRTLFATSEYAAGLPNIDLGLRISNQSAPLAKKHFTAIGMTMGQFEQLCHQTVTTGLLNFREYATESSSGGKSLFKSLLDCMELVHIDPADDTLFQAAGYLSRKDFDEQLAQWCEAAKVKAEAAHAEHCCGDHSHHHHPSPSV